MKTVYLKGRSGGGALHSLYRDLIRCPPEGYSVLTAKNPQGDQRSLSSLDKRQVLVHKVDKKLQDSFLTRNLWYETKTLSYYCIKRIENPQAMLNSGADLVYCSQQITFARSPWIADLEYANALVNYGDIRLIKRIVQKTLASPYCRKILPWSNWARRTLCRSLDCGSFREKIETTHLAVSRKDFVKKENDGRIRFLFVGSINQFNYLNFEWKGGFEVIDAFQELSKKYDQIELTIRSWVPPGIKEKLSSNHNIRVINQALPEEALTRIYESSDVVLFPSHMNLGMAILEAMSYELPVIAINLYDVPEAVHDMETGLLLERPPNVPYYIWNGAPNHYDKTLLPRIRKNRSWIVRQVVDKASLLIEDGSLRRKLGRQARSLTGQGEFSIARRNEKLKRIFDEASSN